MQDDAKLIETLRGLLEKATKGPWYVIDHPRDIWTIQDREEGAGECIALRYGNSSADNATLIVEAVNALPALLDRLSTPPHDRATIRREAFEEAAKVADGFYEDSGWHPYYQQAARCISFAILALDAPPAMKETPA